MCRPVAYMPLSCTGAHTGAPLQGHQTGRIYQICMLALQGRDISAVRNPAFTVYPQTSAFDARKRAGRPSADRRSVHAVPRSPIPAREAVRGAGALPSADRRCVRASPPSPAPAREADRGAGVLPLPDARKRAGRPSADRRSVHASPPSPTPAREAVRGAGVLPLPDARKRAGRPSADRRCVRAATSSPIPAREAVRGAGALPLLVYGMFIKRLCQWGEGVI